MTLNNSRLILCRAALALGSLMTLLLASGAGNHWQ
jgi:hypothetical protein